MVWSAPFGTVTLPGVTSMRYGEAASTSDESSSIADIASRRNAGPIARARRDQADGAERRCVASQRLPLRRACDASMRWHASIACSTTRRTNAGFRTWPLRLV